MANTLTAIEYGDDTRLFTSYFEFSVKWIWMIRNHIQLGPKSDWWGYPIKISETSVTWLICNVSSLNNRNNNCLILVWCPIFNKINAFSIIEEDRKWASYYSKTNNNVKTILWKLSIYGISSGILMPVCKLFYLWLSKSKSYVASSQTL